MKRVLSVLVICVMICTLFVGCGNKQDTTTTPSNSTNDTTPSTEPSSTAPSSTAPEVQGPASALEMMETIWAAWEFEYKDYFMGGGYAEMVSGMPGAVTPEDTEALQFLFYVPEANMADVQSAASVMHGMNANVFTAAGFQVEDASAFATTMQETLMNTQFVCGSPAHLLVCTLGNNFVLYAFGDTENVEGFRTAVSSAYGDMVIVFDGAMG